MLEKMLQNNLLFVIYILTIIGSGIAIGYFFKSLKIQIYALQLQIEDLKQRLIRLENKIMKL